MLQVLLEYVLRPSLKKGAVQFMYFMVVLALIFLFTKPVSPEWSALSRCCL